MIITILLIWTLIGLGVALFDFLMDDYSHPYILLFAVGPCVWLVLLVIFPILSSKWVKLCVKEKLSR